MSDPGKERAVAGHASTELSEAASEPGANPIDAGMARRIRLVVLDVDGVLTDGGVYIGANVSGEATELKRFDIQDGLGMKLLQRSGLEVIIVSGRVSEATRIRADELGIPVHQDGSARKVAPVARLLERKGFGWDEVALLADDLPDLALARRVGLRGAVANAQPEILEIAHWVSERRGGHGAVREFCRELLVARGEWASIVEAYTEARSGE